MHEKPGARIGERIAKYRRIAGFSARELSERAGNGLSRGVIANIESGRKVDITVDQLIALSWALGISPVALALPLDEPATKMDLPTSPGSIGGDPPTAQEVLELWFDRYFSLRKSAPTNAAYGLVHTVLELMDGYRIAALDVAEIARHPERFKSDRVKERLDKMDHFAEELLGFGVDMSSIELAVPDEYSGGWSAGWSYLG